MITRKIKFDKLYKNKNNGLVYKIIGQGQRCMFFSENDNYTKREMSKMYKEGKYGNYVILKNNETNKEIQQMLQLFWNNFERV